MPPDHLPGFDNRLTFGTGRSHYALEIGGKRILYAYIRKNGCSAFKTAMGLASDVSIGAARRLRAGPFGRYDARIFVWRDPEERLVSLYRNKILDRKNAEDLIRRYREVMHEEPSSFERFALFATTGADPHLIAQRHHLRPIRYTHAIELGALHATMCALVGPEAAAPFRVPVNPSRKAPVEVTPYARALLHRIYACDFQMIEAILAQQSRLSAPPG